MTTDPIIWEAPAQTAKGQGRPSKYAPLFDALRPHPGHWARVAEAQASRSQTTRLKGLFPGFEVAARANENGPGFNIYARYNPRVADAAAVLNGQAAPGGAQ